MDETLTVELLAEPLRAAGVDAAGVQVELACSLYASRKLPFGPARRLAGLNVWEFWDALGARQVEVDYTVEDLEHDIRVMEELFGRDRRL